MAIGGALLIWLGYLIVVAWPKLKSNEPGARLNVAVNFIAFLGVIGFLSYIVVGFQA
jgi:hypothetical protein